MYRVCNKTIVDNVSDSGIIFDSNGISNHYWNFKEVSKKYWHPNKFGEYKLNQIISSIKDSSRDSEYDCLIGLSGGIDSSYLLHKMVVDYGIRPLVFHVDGGWNSEIAVNNINNLVNKLDLELFTEVINWEEMRNFQLAMFKSGVPHLDIPQDMAFIGVLYKYAAKHKIKYILNGGNIATESTTLPLNIFYWGTDLVQINDILKKYSSTKMKTYPFTSAFYTKFVARYLRGVKIIKPLNYLPYIKNDVENLLSEKYNFKKYPRKHFESIFTRFYEGYWLPSRFNFDVRRFQYSSLILSGQLEREEALKMIETPSFDENTIEKDCKYVADKLRISTEELEKYRLLPKKYFYNYRNQEKIYAVGEKIAKKLLNTVRGGAY